MMTFTLPAVIWSRGALRRSAATLLPHEEPGSGQGAQLDRTRKLGDVDKGINYYHQALERDPNYTKARQYLGEAYLQKGDVGNAKEQLNEIGNRCGGPCDDYELLVKAIATYVTGEDNTEW
jgi:tetratricopeptide (TPR) repeat protein